MADAGERFGPYRLIRRIAVGGMAEIFLAAIDRGGAFEKRVVVKRILPQLSGDPGFVQMFVDEAAVAGRLSHSNIVQVHDFGELDGLYFMAMEYVDGADLRQLSKHGAERGRPLSFAEVAAIGEGVARGLGYAHSFADERLGPLRIVHRDVSPHNLMISRAGDVKVMDFGIAKAAARATRTATGTLKGKVAYMAPEQARGRQVDGRCDQFALGVVLWECLSGRRLFEGRSELELLRRVLACDVRPLAEVRPDVPGALAAVVMRCLSRDPAARFADMGEVARGLSEFRFSLGKAGAVQLGTVVDELVPRAAPVARHTQVLPDPKAAPADPMDGDTVLTGPPASVPAATVVATGSSPTRPLGGPGARPPSERAREARPSSAAPRGRSSLLGAALVVALLAAAGLVVGVAARRQSPEPTAEGPAASDAHATPAQEQPTAAEAHPRAAVVDHDRAAPVILVPTAIIPSPPGARAGAPMEPRPREQAGQPPARVDASGNGATTGLVSLYSAGAWLDVYLGDRKLGATPLDGLEVPPGVVWLRVVNPGAGIDRVVQVVVPAGGDVRRTIGVDGR